MKVKPRPWTSAQLEARYDGAEGLTGRELAELALDGIAGVRFLEERLDEREMDMHNRIRASYDRTIADAWRAKVAEVEAQRDDARRVIVAFQCGTTAVRRVRFEIAEATWPGEGARLYPEER